MPRSKVPPQDPKEDQLRRRGSLHPHPERVRDPLFQEGGFFDPRDLLQVRYEMVRRVRTEGRSVRETVRTFGVSRPTFYDAQSRLETGGLPALLPSKRGPRQGHKLDDQILVALQRARQEDPGLTTTDLVQLLQTRFGLTVHRRSIERALGREKKRRLLPLEGPRRRKR
jgi:transposase